MPLMSWLRRCLILGLVASCGGSSDDTDASLDAAPDQSTLDAQADVRADGSHDAAVQDVSADTTTTDASADAPVDSAPDVVDASVDVSVDVGGGGCSTNADCSTADYCSKAVGDCGGVGVCMARPFVCPFIVAPVCGCNKATYTNSCYAARGGVDVAYKGACE